MMRLLLTGLGLVSLAMLAGCQTDAYCFSECEDSSTSTGGGAGGDMTSTANFNSDSTGNFTVTGSGGTGGSGGCEPSNGGIEICDDKDNDCNGEIDDIAGIDYDLPQTCGTCATNCYTQLLNTDPTTVTCAPSANPGVDPGICDGDCALDYFDLDNDKSCEYFCVQSAVNDAVCDLKDDDCDGQIDEDVDRCNSLTDCGGCGINCVVLNGIGDCVHTGMDPNCTPLNTTCEIAACNPGWYDLDGDVSTGCEYSCTPTGDEICDGLDNDCDGLIDIADDLSLDARLNQTCQGDPDGICGTPAHAGMTACVANQVVCTGANVLVENQVLETCNNMDDDCDGVIDDTPTDAGGSCGVSGNFPCRFGTQSCINGALQCVGAVNPTTEICDGIDNNCDGTIDRTGNLPPADSVGACNVPPMPPMGATSPCVAGTKACVGGTIQCQGSVLPQTNIDGCNVDANCDGQLTNQPNTQTDVANCGSCGNNCLANALNANWGCSGGACQFLGCKPGFYDLNNDQRCEYQCAFVQAQEICNGVDDNCDGQIDEGVNPPSVVSVCGVSPAASTPECTTNVSVTCSAGAWQCAFPAGVCNPTCAMATEICDGLDNDCDGFINENVPNFGQPCASDDGVTPGHGACRTTGTRVCSGPNATMCSAVKANCSGLPGGCTEACDGIDNDCDGSVDEPYTAKGTDAANWYKPKTVKIGANLWTYAYEASRPSAGALTPGSGNGYWTSAPMGNTLDRTPSCSEQGRLPWFNVTPREVQQTCANMGGFVCPVTDWQTACKPNSACRWGYNPRGAAGSACATAATTTKFCNLGPTFDFDPLTTGDQDGLLVTNSASLLQCFADWSGLQSNPATANKIFDMTGNLREITAVSPQTNPPTYKLMGGAFDAQSETGSECDFTFYTVDQDFKYFDTGFRCCFSSNPG
jgi:hypothetical protein